MEETLLLEKRTKNRASSLCIGGGIRTHMVTLASDFESCSHLVLSCLLWPVTAVLETAKTLALQRISDAPTGIDQFHIRKDQSSN